MIYVSSSCVKNKTIKESVLELAVAGFKNIELSGGTQYYDSIEQDLLALKSKYDLIFLCHNYFPPPKINFVINLASLNQEINDLSLNHLKNSIYLSKSLNATVFGFHAGFLINIPVNQIGKSISNQQLFDSTEATNKFIENYNTLKKISNVKLYIENNVLSNTNFLNFGNINPFLMTHSSEILELKSVFDFDLLLDVAHLKVSCNTLGLNFENELNALISQSNYIHISDNDGFSDSNGKFLKDSELYKQLKKYDFSKKTITLEVYGTLEELKESYVTAQSLYI